MTETFTRWNLEDYIKAPDNIRGLLEAAADEDPGDGTVIRAVLNAIARAQNMSTIARNAGLNRGNLYEALSEDGNPSLATTAKIARALGLRLRLEPVQKIAEESATPAP